MGLESVPAPNLAAFLNAPVPVTPDIDAQVRNDQQAQLQAQVQRQQIAHALIAQKQLADAKTAFIANPTPEATRALAALDPTGFGAIKDQHAMQTADVQNQSLRDLTAIHSNLTSGNKDAAAAILQNRITADKKAGQDSTADEAMLAQIGTDPHGAANTTLGAIAAALGPDKYDTFYNSTINQARADKEEPGKLALTAAQTAQANAAAGKDTQQTANLKNPPPETAAIVNPTTGEVTYYNKNAPPPVGASAVTPDLSAFVDKLGVSENNTGDPNAKNPRSSATGNGQFVNATWLQQMRANHPELVQGKTDDQVLAMRSDPKLSRQMTVEYAQANAAALAQANLPVNGATLAMSHKLGPDGAQTVLAADPSAPLTAILPANVIAANPQLKGQTAGSYASGLAHTFGVTPIAATADPNLTGDDYLKTLPPARARLIQSIANGDAPMPTGRSIASGPGMNLMQQVLQYDPTASAINLDSRKKTRENFTTGTAGQAINSVNTVTGHLVGLDNAIDRLGSTGIPVVNGVSQFIERNAGNKDMQKALGNFNFYKTAVANELTKVFRGSNGAEADVQGWMKELDAAKSPDELHQTVRSMVDGMQSRIDSLTSQYNIGMGKVYSTVPGISPHTQALLASLKGSGQTASAPPTQAIQVLMANPKLAPQFDAKYGQGASAQYLNGGQ